MSRPTLTADSILIAEADGTVKWCNASAAEAFGLACGLPLDINEYALLGRALAGERIEGAEMCLRETRWFTLTAEPIFTTDADGKVESVIAVFHEITEHRRAEQLFRRLMDSNIVGIALWNKQRAITEANGAFLRMLGRSAIQAERPLLDDLATPEFAEAAGRAFAEIRERGVCELFPCEFLNMSGGRVPVLAGGAALDGGTGLIFALDLSERSRLEEKLRQSAKLESLGILAGGIAHDFNNLLTGILGNASLALEESAEGSNSAVLLRSVILAGERAAALTQQMLAYSGRGRFRSEPVNVSTLVSETLDLIESALGKGVRLNLNVDAALPPVLADPSQLQQIIMNLAINAAESIDNKGEVTVLTGIAELDGSRHPDDVSPESAAAAGRYVFLEVRDAGPGMDRETVERIFDPFFTTKSVGRGLGLASVLGIVRNHKGAIRVRSSPGQGTIFRVYLPASRSEAAGSEPGMPRGRSQTGIVLVVDDEVYVRETARRMLESAGYTAVCAAGAAEALQLFQSLGSRIDLAIVDLTMPGVTGDELARRLRHHNPELRVIATSGYGEEEVKAKFGDLMNAFLPKPYTSGSLCEIVALTLAR